MGNEILSQVKRGIQGKLTGAILEWLSSDGSTVVTYLCNVSSKWTLRLEVEIHSYNGLTVTASPVKFLKPSELPANKQFTPDSPEPLTVPESHVNNVCVFLLAATSSWVDYHLSFDVIDGTVEVSYTISNVEARALLKDRALASSITAGTTQLAKFMKYLVIGIQSVVDGTWPCSAADTFSAHMLGMEEPAKKKPVDKDNDVPLTESGNNTATAVEDDPSAMINDVDALDEDDDDDEDDEDEGLDDDYDDLTDFDTGDDDDDDDDEGKDENKRRKR